MLYNTCKVKEADKLPHFMVKFRNIFALFLLLGLVYAELLPTINSFDATPAKSQSVAEEEQKLLRSLIESSASSSLAQFNSNFVDISLPTNPADVGQDIRDSSSWFYRLPNPLDMDATQQTLPAASLLQPSQLLQTVLPTLGSELYYAYQDGGRAWYEKGDNLLVIFPDETIRSFNKKTGESTTWLQKELAYPPIDDAEAITNYQKNYNAKPVAETSKWVLTEFPSGGILKVLKPSYTTSNTGGSIISGLPNILPGYGS